ncbi:hypothetical protein B7494_g8346 [Chlorociboria aeruginascens]|nr:hypothetical protein B7494_g8346 [Chlorociboria aeruginascens]
MSPNSRPSAFSKLNTPATNPLPTLFLQTTKNVLPQTHHLLLRPLHLGSRSPGLRTLPVLQQSFPAHARPMRHDVLAPAAHPEAPKRMRQMRAQAQQDEYHDLEDCERRNILEPLLDGLEMAAYQGLEVSQYTGNASDGFDKPESHYDTMVYNEDPRSSLKRELKTRQLAMIALGGALGTGLIVNTGPTLAQVGPGSMLIGYAMGEMAAWLPIPSGFTGFATRFVDPALGFALGWNYWFKYIILAPNNLIASVLVIQYWFNEREYTGPGASAAIYVTIILVTIVVINYFGVGLFGEFEFWLSSMKVLILIGLIIMTIVLTAGGGPDHDAKGFRYWKDPGAFNSYKIEGNAGRFLAFWSVLTTAVFSFLGAELVGVTVGEAKNPRRAIPRAVKLTFYRIVIFYIILILLLGMNVPYNSPLLLSANNESSQTISANASPFVVAAKIAKVKALPSIINGCILIFTFSAASSDLYISTRTLYSLAVQGNAPYIFSRTNSRGVPIYALALSSSICLIAFMSIKTGTFKTFQYFISLVTIFGILTWISILVCHIYFIRARTAQKIPDSALPYVSPFGLRGSFAALVFACLITVFNGWADFIRNDETGKFDWKDFIVNYIGIPVYLLMILGYKLVMGTKGVTAMDADLWGGKARIDREENEFLAAEVARRGTLETRGESSKMSRFTPSPQNAQNLKDKVVVMTGGSSGIGAASLPVFLSKGARVVFGDINITEGQKQVAKSASPNLKFVKTDVTKYEDLIALFDLAYRTWGRVDVALNIAGSQEVGNFVNTELTLEEVRLPPSTTTLSVNLTGSMYFARIAVVYLKQGQTPDDDKSLILFSSVAAFKETPGMPAYMASKHGVLGLMRGLKLTLPTSNIRINTVCPWYVETIMTSGIAEVWKKNNLPINMPTDIANIIVDISAEKGMSGKAIYYRLQPQWLGEEQARELQRGNNLMGSVGGESLGYEGNANEY